MDFTEQEIINLRFQLQHFILDAPHDPNLKNLSTISKHYQVPVKTTKSKVYFLLERLIRLILALPISTTTS